ncbi:HigA family addiction module antitoxin [Mesorhizobium sp. CN5-321]|jgi:addiction module HigA family antidote|uniref:HigA family addiction module antitoxin n=1 Tax=Mesorhizobium hunchu TaxID=3157708 RepID=UPI0032B867A3
MSTPRPIHPGEILREDFLPEYDLTPSSLASALHVPRDRIEKIVRGKRAVSADTALRLARYFGTTPQFWMNLQANFDLASVADEDIGSIQPRAA